MRTLCVMLAFCVSCSSGTGGTGGGSGGAGGGSAGGGSAGGGSAGGGSAGGGSAGGGSAGGGSAGGGSAGGGSAGGGSAGGGSVGGGSAGGGSGQSCQWADGGFICPAGEYCDAPGCAAGNCRPILPMGSVSQSKAVVCGCNRVNYWNETVAAAAGMARASTGTCGLKVASCGGLLGQMCPNGATCSYQVDSKTECNVSDLGGVCWGLPPQCPTIVSGNTTRACAAVSCTDECNLIRLQTAWYVDSNCP